MSTRRHEQTYTNKQKDTISPRNDTANCTSCYRTAEQQERTPNARFNFCRAMRCISAAYVVVRCVPVTLVDCVKTNKDIFEIFFHHRVATPL